MLPGEAHAVHVTSFHAGMCYVDRVLYSSVVYPHNYGAKRGFAADYFACQPVLQVFAPLPQPYTPLCAGFIPQTLCEDHDPLVRLDSRISHALIQSV